MSVLLNESAEPITRCDQLVTYFSSASRPKEKWLIGCEHEKFPYRLSTLKPVSYDEPNGIRALLNAMTEYGWQPVLEGDHIIGLKRDSAGISLEPGCQFELAGAPFQSLHEIEKENQQHLREVCAIGEKLDIGFLGMGFHPAAKRSDIRLVPKDRYHIQFERMPKRGSMALDMMLRTCTVQVNLDFSDEADMVKKYRVSLALQPIATALFASSPFIEGKASEYNSYRMHVWTDVDPSRCGPLPFVFEDGFGFERYTNYALDVPMQFLYRDGRYIDAEGQSFRDFMKGTLPALPGAHPTINDWANHLTTIFPDVRMKKIIEMRGADVGSPDMLVALPAFWTGLLYDSSALDAAWDLVKDWTEAERNQLKEDVTRQGLGAQIRNLKLSKLAYMVLTLSQQGLRARAKKSEDGKDETKYLHVLFAMAENGQNRADELLKLFQQTNGNMKQIFESGQLLPKTAA